MSYQIEVEYTDTFGGEPNYSWVHRATLTIEDEPSDLALWRRIKKCVGLNNVRGQSSNNGDTWEFRPAKSCTILMACVIY